MVEQRVKTIVAQQLGLQEANINLRASFIEDFGADEINLAGLIGALESDFSIEIPREEAEQITTTQAAIDYVTSHAQLS